MKNFLFTLGLSVALPLFAWAADTPGNSIAEQAPTSADAENLIPKAPATSILGADITSTIDKSHTAENKVKEEATVKRPTPRQLSDYAFAVRDLNKDGKISSYEFTQYGKIRFAILDKDRKGYVTIDAYYKTFFDKAGAPGNPSKSERFFAMEDQDKDGKITQYESIVNSSNFFKKIDKDQDQVITSDEFFVYQQEIGAMPAQVK